jgi:hypothetical protein
MCSITLPTLPTFYQNSLRYLENLTMAPKRNHHSTLRGRKTSQHHQTTASNTNTVNNTFILTDNISVKQQPSANSHESVHPNTSPNNSVGQHSFVNIYESGHHGTSTDDQLQTNNQATYVRINLKQQENLQKDLPTSDGNLPMQRWQSESMVEQPWHGIRDVLARKSQNFTAMKEDNHDIKEDASGGILEDGDKNELGSMNCVASSSEMLDRSF